MSWVLTVRINDRRKAHVFRTRARAREIGRTYRAYGWRTSVTKGE